MDDDDFPPVCEKDVEVIKQIIGMTDISLNKNEAIRIFSQDRATVTVQLQQELDAPPPSKLLKTNDPAFLASPWIDYLYYVYRPDNFDEVCFEETHVQDQKVYVKDITIQCAVTKPYALLEICIADDVRNERLQFNSGEKNAVVPQCCHPSFPPDTTPVLCYTVKIKCVSECVDDVEEENDNENENEKNIRAEESMAETRRRRRTLLRGSK